MSRYAKHVREIRKRVLALLEKHYDITVADKTWDYWDNREGDCPFACYLQANGGATRFPGSERQEVAFSFTVIRKFNPMGMAPIGTQNGDMVFPGIGNNANEAAQQAIITMCELSYLRHTQPTFTVGK